MLSVLNKPSLPSFYVCATWLKWAEEQKNPELPSEPGEVGCELCYFWFYICVCVCGTNFCWICFGISGDEMRNFGDNEWFWRQERITLSSITWRSCISLCWCFFGRTGKVFLRSNLSFWLTVCVPGCFLPASWCAVQIFVSPSWVLVKLNPAGDFGGSFYFWLGLIFGLEFFCTVWEELGASIWSIFWLQVTPGWGSGWILGRISSLKSWLNDGTGWWNWKCSNHSWKCSNNVNLAFWDMI